MITVTSIHFGKYPALLILCVTLAFCCKGQSFIGSPKPADNGPGAILVVNDNVVQSVNLITGSTVPIFADPIAGASNNVLNDLAVNPNTGMIYYVINSGCCKVYEIDYYNFFTRTFGVLTSGLTGVSGGAAPTFYPDLNQSGACMADDGNLYIADQLVTAGVNRQTRIFQVRLDPTGTNVTGSSDYVWMKNNPGGPIAFGDFIFWKNMLLCTTYNPARYSYYNSPFTIGAPGKSPAFSIGYPYSQIAAGWDGTVYTVNTGPVTLVQSRILQVTNVLTGDTVYTGITLPLAGNNSGGNYKDVAGPVPAIGTIKGNLNCYPPGTQVNIWYDVDQDGKLDKAIDKLVTTTPTNAAGDYLVLNLIPDYYIMEIPSTGQYFSTLFNYGGGQFLYIGDTWVQDQSLPGGCAILPLSLKAKAAQAGSNILVKWTAVGDPSNVQSFEIEKSGDGIHFNTIGKIQKAENADSTDYQFLDKTPLYGNNFYRIRQTSANSSFIYSNIDKVFYEASGEVIKVLAGVHSGVIDVALKSPFRKESTLTVFNNIGQVIQVAKLEPGKLHGQINVPSTAKGIYYIRVDNNDFHFVKKLLLP